MKIVNVSKRKYTIDNGQGSKDLAPSQEMEVKDEIAKSLVSSFTGEIKIVEVVIEEKSEPMEQEVAQVQKKKGKK